MRDAPEVTEDVPEPLDLEEPLGYSQPLLFACWNMILFKNNGDGTFTDVTAAAGLVDTAVGMGAVWGDYHKDGYLDLYVANEGQDFLYRNNHDGTFNEVAEYSGMTDRASGRGAAWFDYSNDGFVDLFVSNADTGDFLYKNPARSGPVPASAIPQIVNDDQAYLVAAALWFMRFWRG